MMDAGATLLAQGRIDEFVSDPVLTVACVLLVAVSIGWIVTSRAITKNMRRAAERQRRRPPQPRRRSPDTRTQPTRRVPPPR